MNKILLILFLALSTVCNAQWLGLNRNSEGGETEFITEWDLLAESFTYPLKASSAYDMTIDWGDGSPLSDVTSSSDPDRIHTYSSAGTYHIKVDGLCTSFYVNNNVTIDTKLTKVIQWGNVGFTTMERSFFGCSNLSELPEGSITGADAVSTLAFRSAFSLCSSLTIIPDGLFDNCTLASSDAFNTAFFGCSGITLIPSGLFDNCTLVSSNGFVNVFRDCVNLTSIPVGLFDNCTLVSTGGFYTAFYGCSSLEEVPDGLFRYNTLVSVNGFRETFFGCIKAKLNQYIFYASGEESTRFLNDSPNFYRCFYRTSFTGTQGTAPNLWDCDFGTGTPTTNDCYAGAGNSITSLSNYGDIPPEYF